MKSCEEFIIDVRRALASTSPAEMIGQLAELVGQLCERQVRLEAQLDYIVNHIAAKRMMEPPKPILIPRGR